MRRAIPYLIRCSSTVFAILEAVKVASEHVAFDPRDLVSVRLKVVSSNRDHCCTMRTPERSHHEGCVTHRVCTQPGMFSEPWKTREDA